MDSSVTLQLIITIGTVLGTVFATYKYSVGQGVKREKIFLDYIQEMQDKQLEYYTQKNGHLERISKLFSNTIDKNTRAIDKLSARLKEKR